MKVGTLRALCAAAVAGALAVPALAQNTDSPTAEGATRQSPNGARGAEGEARTVRPNAGQAQSEQTRPGATLRPNAPSAGTIVEEQDNLQPGTRTANFPPQAGRQGQGQGQLGDAGLVRWLSANNESEIRISEVAQQKAQNEQVKQFAQMLVDEHTKLGEKLQQAAGQGGQGGQGLRRGQGRTIEESSGIEERTPNRRNARETDANENRPNTDNANDDNNVSFLQEDDQDNRRLQDRLRNADQQNDAAQRGAAAGGMRGGANAGVALHEQIKQACTQAFIQELQSKNGAEFDKCYMGQQILAHQDTLATLKVISQQASSPELKQTLQGAQQSTQQHLQKAKDVMKQLENERQ